jgi:HAD superfamily hydrolase (TIGR01490 family)
VKNLCLFDLDHTLLPLDSDYAWGQFVVAQGWVDADEFGRGNDLFRAQYEIGILNIDDFVEFSTRAWRDKSPAELEQAHAKFMRSIIEPALHWSALDLVQRHQTQGDLTALVTATNEFVTAPIAQRLGIEHLIALKLERDSAGQVNGKIDGVPSFRDGKVARVHQWLQNLNLHLSHFEKIFVYSDSINDLPLLSMATDPVATNPAPSLQAVALQKGWRVVQLFTT